MDINVEKMMYYLGGVGFLLLVGVVYYFIRGKKMVEEELKKQLEEREEARIEGEGDNGLYTLCPNPVGVDGNAPDIVISDSAGEIHDKIHTVPPRIIYTNCPKTEEDWVNQRRDAVIQMIIAEGGEPFH